MKPTKCPNCGDSMAVGRVNMNHHRRLPNGRQVKMRFRDVPVEECLSCGERYFQARTIKEMDRAIDDKYGVRRRRAA